MEMDSGDWSWEENKKFEMALAAVEEDDPGKWKKIASAIGGRRSRDEIEKHYKKLSKDLEIIESGGVVAHEFTGKADCCNVDCRKNHELPLELRMDEDCFSHIMEIVHSSKL